MQRKGEEDEERGQGEAEVKRRRGEEVEPRPPPKVPLLDPELEDEAHDAPGEVVEGRGRGNGAGSAEYEGCHQVADRGPGPALGGEVDDDGRDGADYEEGEKARVDLTG